MQNDIQLSQPEVAPSMVLQHQPRKSHRGLWELLVVLLIVCAAIGGYVYGQNKTTPTDVKTPVTSTPAPATNSGEVHFVESVGVPEDLGNKMQIKTRLGVPSSMQAVRSTAQSSAAGLFTDKDNNDMGHWVYGVPQNDDDNSGGDSELALYAISKSWLAATNTTDNTTSAYIGNTVLKTPAQKQKYIADLKTQTTTCAANKDKGFTTKDKVLNVCYTLVVPKDTYKPKVTLLGYGEIEKQPMVFVGFVNIYDSSQTSSPNTKQVALQKLVAALGESTITALPYSAPAQ